MKHFFIVAAVCAAVILCCGCSSKEAFPGSGGGSDRTGGVWQSADAVWRYTDVAMGTVIQMSLYASDQETAKDTAEAVMDLLVSLEQEQISWRLETSEVFRINEAAGSRQGIMLSSEMAQLLGKAKELHEKSEGVFDITLGPVIRLWSIDQWAAGQEQGDFQTPSKEEINAALDRCGADKLILQTGEQEGECIVYLPQGMQLDLGAVGKGYAQTKLCSMLEGEEEITGAVISLGGSVLTWGSKPDGSNWKIGITDPFDTGANVGILALSGQWCISTSGDYERYVELDGVRYHHILDPATGYPADSGVRGVTILSKEGLLGDALSTACFILGPEKGMELAAEYETEVLFILSDGEIVMSEGMERYFTAR